MSQGGGPSLDLEETLFAGVVQGDVGEYADLLAQIRDVDVRGVKGRTLLHVATRGGRVDWAEALLQKGADPEMRDGDGFTVVEVASQMCSRHPGDGGRESIRRLVRVVHGRDAARSGGLFEGCDASGHDSRGHLDVPRLADDEPCIKRVRKTFDVVAIHSATQTCENSSVKDKIPSETEFLREGIDEVKAKIDLERTSLLEALSREVTVLETSQSQKLESLSSSIKEEMASLSTAMTSLREVVDSLRAEVTSQNERQLGVEAGMTSTNSEVRNLRETLTSLAEDVRVSREQLKEEMRRSQSNNESSNSKTLNCDEEMNKRMVQDECISALMAATEILDADEERTAMVRRAYERVYSCSTLTSPLLTFLQRQPGVKVIIDCSSNYIGRMKNIVMDHDGVESRGSGYCFSFADLEEKTAYVDGYWGDEMVSGYLAMALAQLAVSLAFNNGGRPYREGDGDRGREMRRVVQEAEEEKRRGLGGYINTALYKTTQLAKEIHLISAVPAIIAEYGSAKGTSILSDQVPSLLPFYNDHVLPALSP